MNSRLTYQRHETDVRHIPTSCNQRMGNLNLTIRTQPAGANQNNAYRPGTHNQTPQYWGTNQRFPQPSPTNPFLPRQMGIPWFQNQRTAGTNPNAVQHPRTNLHLNPTPNQIGSVHAQFPGPPLFTPRVGTFQFQGNGQICGERIPSRATFQFQPATTRVNNKKLTPSRQRHNKWFVNSALFGLDERVEKQQKEEGSPQVEEASQAQKEIIAKINHIKHLSTSYSKVKALELLCEDLQTPVFGDFPGYEQERTIMKNLAHFLKEQINEIKRVEEEEKRKNWLENFEPNMRAPFPVIAIKIRELENKRNMLEKERKDSENLNKEGKNCAGEHGETKKEADMLKAEVEAYDIRLKAMRERQSSERKSIDSKRIQHEREMEEINKTYDHSLHEGLRSIQEKIVQETKLLVEVKKELYDMKNENECIQLRISETVAKNEEFKKLCAKS